LRRGLHLRVGRRILLIVSLLLAAATFTILVLVLSWTWQVGPYYVWIAGYGYSGIGWHWGIALGLAPLFLIHVWKRWPRPRKTDFMGRRQAIKLIGLGAAAIAGWGFAESLARSIERSGTPRRFAGSREQGSFTGLDYPVTSGPDQGKERIDSSTWTLTVTGRVKNPLRFSYEEILARSSSETTATIDCTGGWCSTQIWRGVWLSDLLSQAGLQTEGFIVVLKGISAYDAFITPAEVPEVLLATRVGEKVLDHWHGFPLRAVVPSRRGWHWVKWMTEIEIVTL
jgi:DMSO/TMAO reductase YedYZ molybdopterin-dependent catalytic subunit